VEADELRRVVEDGGYEIELESEVVD